MVRLGRDTSKLDALSKKADEIKRSFESGKISAQKYADEIGKIKGKLDSASSGASRMGDMFKTALTAAA